MQQRQVLLASRRLIDRLPAIPRPWNVEVLCQRIAHRRSRELVLHELNIPALPVGLWYDDGVRDHIIFRQGIVGYYRDHVILHEIGHLLAGHGLIRTLLSNGQRSKYSHFEEHLAEEFASETLRLATGPTLEPASDFETRTAMTFGLL
jgi:hypothetical protein